MRLTLALGVALAASAGVPVRAADFATAGPLAGNWTYGATATGSEAVFTGASGNPQLWMQCTRATRRVSIAKAATGAAPFLDVWTSSLARNIPSSFNPATGRLTVDLGAYDPLFDAIAGSRGRIAFIVGALPPLVLPSRAEPSRVIEDCRV